MQAGERLSSLSFQTLIETHHANDANPLFRIKVNDFVGQGYGALDLDLDSEVVELMPGSISKMNDLGPKVCVGAGTGLGECYLTRSSLAPGLGYECYPSEGGHVDFVPRDDLGVELWKHLREKFDGANRVSVERVVSGRGLANVYEFLAGRFPERVDKEIHDEFLGAGDQQGRVVGVNASKGGSLTELAARIMIASYGSEVGNAGEGKRSPRKFSFSMGQTLN